MYNKDWQLQEVVGCTIFLFSNLYGIIGIGNMMYDERIVDGSSIYTGQCKNCRNLTPEYY
jgi:hypothetical protein